MLKKIPMLFLLFSFNVQSNNEEMSISEEIDNRLNYEKQADENPFSLTTHKMNYILPYTYADNINTDVYTDIDDLGLSDEFENEEVKFQLSVKFPLLKRVFNDEDMIYFGFTMKSYWQLYAQDASRPFRNTDYNPEIFYLTEFSQIKDRSNFLMIGFEHESNGQVQYLSRSWNRAYVQVGTKGDYYALALKGWYRIPEDEKEEQFSPKGDDNPDIEDYYGKFELSGIYKHGKIHYSAIGRYNFAEGKGFIEMGATFPLYGNMRGYVQFVNGYGESLLDYNHLQRRIGIGIAFSDIL